MNTVGQRIKALRLQLGLTQQAFADALGGVTRGAVGNWERDQGIKTENILLISQKLGAPVDWLAAGSQSPDVDRRQVVDASRRFRIDRAVQQMRAIMDAGAPPEEWPEFLDGDGVPVIGEVAAGTWLEKDELDEPPPASFSVGADPRWMLGYQRAWIVKGRSLERVAKEGDILIGVLIDHPLISPKHGDLVVVERWRDDGELFERTAKRIRLTQDALTLVPEYLDPTQNVAIQMPSDGATSIRIVAVVVGIYRPLRR